MENVFGASRTRGLPVSVGDPVVVSVSPGFVCGVPKSELAPVPCRLKGDFCSLCSGVEGAGSANGEACGVVPEPGIVPGWVPPLVVPVPGCGWGFPVSGSAERVGPVLSAAAGAAAPPVPPPAAPAPVAPCCAYAKCAHVVAASTRLASDRRLGESRYLGCPNCKSGMD